MKKHLQVILAIIILTGLSYAPTQAQSIELVAGNTLNGAMNGVILGGATMALQNSSEFEPVRVGLGAGTLYGIGMGIYDISRVNKGQQFYISGTFNDGTNTSILLLFDTFYGAAGGAIIASSISLIAQEPIDKALQYGAGAGAWVGFGFGIVDAFVLAEGPDFSQQTALSSSPAVDGLLTYSNASQSLQLGMLSPGLIAQKKLSSNSLITTYSPSLNVFNVKVEL